MKISKDDIENYIEYLDQGKYEMKHFLEYLEYAYSTEMVNSFLTAFWLGVSDSAHYELFFDQLQKARLEHGY